MSGFGNCDDPENFCLACNNGDTPMSTQLRFGESTPSDNSQKTAYNGLMNSKNFRTSASSFVILKKSLTTIQSNNIPDLFSSSKAGVTCCGGPARGVPGDNNYKRNDGPSNTGGPGDAVESVPIITSGRSGWKGRLVTLPHQTGVDVKHNSYERYLARKRGWAMQCSQNCKSE
tara:strand:- start:43 stop:561 length:519 start_codon:yes stop_codon:yes gene_type:complete